MQIIRAAGIIQALLGNTGRPGGGVLALRGHASIQGRTDIPTLYNLLPGYLPQPHAKKRHRTFENYVEIETVPTGWWHNFPKCSVSLLRAWYGDHATHENEWGYNLPSARSLPSKRILPGLVAGFATMAGFALVAAAVFFGERR